MRLVFLGAPGAGKGTQAKILGEKLDLPHIATGDLFREAQQKQTELGRIVKSYMEKGLLVPDEIVIKVIEERLSQPDCRKGFILDGFPRTIAQAEALDEMLGRRGEEIDRAVYIKVSEEELIRRLSGRWICRNCQTPYHERTNPPKIPGRCDRCGGELYQRADDTEEAVRKRIEVYMKETAPLIEYYSRRGKLVEVNGERGIEEVARDLWRALGL